MNTSRFRKSKIHLLPLVTAVMIASPSALAETDTVDSRKFASDTGKKAVENIIVYGEQGETDTRGSSVSTGLNSSPPPRATVPAAWAITPLGLANGNTSTCVEKTFAQSW